MNITLDEFSLKLAPPLPTATGMITDRRGFLITIENEPGGHGEATPLPGWTESFTDCRASLRTAKQQLNDGGRSTAISSLGSVPAARHGLSLALHDYDARGTREPLYRALGTREQIDWIPVNKTIGAHSLQETATAVRHAVSTGYQTIKLKVGASAIEDEVTRITTVYDQLPPSMDLRLDANGSWTVETAQSILSSLNPDHISYVEQPLPPAAGPNEYRDLCEYGIPLAVDEALATQPHQSIIAEPSIDVLILKPMVLGGIDRARSLATTAADHGKTCIVTTTFDSSIARTAAVHLAAHIDPESAHGLATASHLETDLVSDPLPVTNGMLPVPQSDGIGITPTLSTTE